MDQLRRGYAAMQTFWARRPQDRAQEQYLIRMSASAANAE